MRTFGGYIKKGKEKKNFEVSARNKTKAYKEIKREYPDWNVQVKESHKSVYNGKFGHPKLRKYKNGKE